MPDIWNAYWSVERRSMPRIPYQPRCPQAEMLWLFAFHMNAFHNAPLRGRSRPLHGGSFLNHSTFN
jgi:hypothetical protein